MPYLNHPYVNSFKELCASMPLFYLDVYEMREILKVQGRIADELRASTERVISNEFILLADEQTVALWEGMLGITYDKPMTLDERKAVIMGHICGYAHIGEPEIREIASLYTESKVSVAFSKGVIYIDVEGVDLGFALSNFLDTLLKRIPAHLALKYFSTFTGYQIQPGKMRTGGTGSIFMEIPIPQTVDGYDFKNTARIGGAGSVERNIPVPQAEDSYDLYSKTRIGMTGAVGANISIPEKPDDFQFKKKAGIGGAGAVSSSIPVPQQEEQFNFKKDLHTGGVGMIGPSMAVPEQEDTFQFRNSLQTGATGAAEASIPVPERANNAKLKSRINTGGRSIGVTASLSVPEIKKEE